MWESLEEVNALDKTYEIASASDGVVILTYSLSSIPIHSILSRLQNPKKIRVMYSAKSDGQATVSQLKGMEKNCKALEISSGIDRYETSHAKIYLFCKTGKRHIGLKVILGSFNLTLQTLKSVEIYGVYEFQINRDFLEKNGIKHFLEVFSLDGQLNFDLESLKQGISGGDKEIGYEVLLLLLQLWLNHVHIITNSSFIGEVDFFGEENKRMFVSTFSYNTLLARLRDLLKSAFVYANETEKEVELTIVTPFHTEEAIERLFWLKDQVVESIGLKRKVKFSLRLLTNSFNVSGDIGRSSFSNPMFLRTMMFDSTRAQEFQVKFWGYTPGNEDFIHAKVYVIRVGEHKTFLITSANLTLSGFGFELNKNLEVGVIENHPDCTEGLYRWVNECWNSEYTIDSGNDKIWSELQNWYERLEETEEVEEDFDIKGLTDLYIYEKNVVKVKDKRNRTIEFMKLILSFPKKEKPVKNLEELFEKKGAQFHTEFELKEEHLGPVFCDIIAKLSDGSYIFITQQKINVMERFPEISMHALTEIDVPKDFLMNTIPVEVEVEIGKGILKIDLTKVSFQLQRGKDQVDHEILLIRERSENSRILQILLWTSEINASHYLRLILLYEGKKIATCEIPESILEGLSRRTDDRIASFLKQRFVHLLSDERTLCPKKKVELTLNFDQNIAELLGTNLVSIIRDFSYSELVGTERITKQIAQEVQLTPRIRLDNNLPSYPPTDVEVWIYAVRKGKWIWWVPVGRLNYQLLKNPPDLEVEDKTPVKTNIAPIEMEFKLIGPEVFRDQVVLEYRIGKWKRILSTRHEEISCNLPENLDLEKLEKGINLRYRLTFKYNIADIVGNIHIAYDYFISSPHPSDSTKTKMLIYDPEKPHELLTKVSKEIHRNKMPVFTVIPTNTTSFKEFQLQLSEKDLEETKSVFPPLRTGTFALKKLSQEILGQFKSRKNVANLKVILVPQGTSSVITILFDILYLEGVETDCIPTIRGGFGKTITVHHPEEYQGEFRDDIVKIVRLAYSKHLDNYHISRVREDEEIITEIRNFIEEVRSKRFVPYFRPRNSLQAYEETTLQWRRVVDFLLFIRRGRHKLRIKVKPFYH